MEPDNITLGEGTLYIDGVPFGGIREVSFEATEEELPILGETPKLVVPASQELSFTCEMDMTTFREVVAFARIKAIIEAAPARLRHLALHSKKYRTRKKNLTRILCDYQRRDRI